MGQRKCKGYNIGHINMWSCVLVNNLKMKIIDKFDIKEVIFHKFLVCGIYIVLNLGYTFLSNILNIFVST
jgi:hypothetical protein